jgi:hypothetical protein
MIDDFERFGRKRSWPNRGTIAEFAWRIWEKPWKPWGNKYSGRIPTVYLLTGFLLYWTLVAKTMTTMKIIVSGTGSLVCPNETCATDLKVGTLALRGNDNVYTEVVFVYITLLQQLVITVVCSDPVTLYSMFSKWTRWHMFEFFVPTAQWFQPRDIKLFINVTN